MSDLIMRKALMEALVKAEEECEDAMCVPSWATALRVIRSQPTAYDIDKVVEQLEETAWEYESFGYEDSKVVDLVDAIEIVKKGGAV